MGEHRRGRRLSVNATMAFATAGASTQPLAPTGAYSGYAVTPDGRGEYDVVLLNGSTANPRAALLDAD